MVLFTMAKNDVQSMTAAKKVTGKATSKNTDKKTITVDGTVYETAKNMDTTNNLTNFNVNGKDDATLYLDQFGYVISAESGTAATSDKAVAVVDGYQTLNKDGKIVHMMTGVTSDGETVTWEVASDASGDIGEVKTYTEKDGVYTLGNLDSSAADKASVETTTGANGIDANTKKIEVKGTSYYFTNDLKTIFVDYTSSTDKTAKVTVLDGVQKADASKDAIAVMTEIDAVRQGSVCQGCSQEHHCYFR